MKKLYDYNFSNVVPDYYTRSEFMDKICKNYTFIKKRTLAKSLCNRNIDYFEIGDQQEPVLFAGAFHGMEWLTSLLLIKFAISLGNAIQNNKYLSGINISNKLKNSGLVILPCVNPDGVEISLHGSNSAGSYQTLVDKITQKSTGTWQANARGVDINHNFDAGWEEVHKLEQKIGITKPSATRYGGTHPESEPETKALVRLCKNYNFRHALAFHSQGQEIYWNYGKKLPEKSELIAKIMSISSGYKLSEPEQIATGGGFKDWFIKYFNKPGFTIEIGLGKNPLPLSDLQKIYTQLEEMLVLCILI